MTLSVASGFPVTAGGGDNVGCTTVNIGDVVIVVAGIGANETITSITDSNNKIAWDSIAAIHAYDSVNTLELEIWKGVVTSIGFTTIVANASPVAVFELGALEFNSGVYGSATQWTITASGSILNSVTTPLTTPFPSLLSSNASEQAYVGYAQVAANFSTAPSSGCTGFTVVSGFGGDADGFVFNPTLTGLTTYQPITTDSGAWTNTVGIIVTTAPLDWVADTNCAIALTTDQAFNGTESLAVTAISTGAMDAYVNRNGC